MPSALSHMARFVSRRSSRLIPLGLVVGLAVPPLAHALRPALPGIVVVLLVAPMIRIEPHALIARLRRPTRALLASLWMMVVLPVAVLGIATALGIGRIAPEAMLIVLIATVPPPINSAPTFTLLAGLDASLTMGVLIVGILAMPIVTPVIAHLFSPADLSLSALALARNLFSLLAGAVAVAVLIRRLAGPVRIAAAAPLVDSVAVAGAFTFAVASMDGVTAAVVERPGTVAILLAAVFLVAFAQMAATYLLFRFCVFRGHSGDAVAVAYCSSSRNMGLILSAVGVTTVPTGVWLWFALAQVPVFMIPILFRRVGHRLSAVRT